MLNVILFRFGLFCVGLITIGLIGEGVARVFDVPQAYTAIFQYDDLLGYRYVTDETVEYADRSGRHPIRFDREGVLDAAGENPGSLIILGDGVVAGLELSPEKRLSSQIVRLGGRGVTNLAVPGYGPLQQVLQLEEWLQKNPPPKQVVIVYNLSNDLIDNVPAWEGTSIPGIQRGPGPEAHLIRPKLPSRGYQLVGQAVKRLRLYGWYQRQSQREGTWGISPQQEWLYLEDPPSELEEGLFALNWSSQRLRSLAEKNGFSVVVIDWVDWGLIKASDKISFQQRAAERSRRAIGFKWIEVEDLYPRMDDSKQWEERWLVAGPRHANAEAIAILAKAIVNHIP